MNLEPTDHTVGVAFSQWERPEVFSHVFPSRHNHGRIGRLEHCWTLEMRGNPITVSGHKVTNESIQLVFSGRTFDHATAPRQTCQPDQYEYARSRFDLPRFLAPETSVSTTGLSSPGGIHYACPSTSVALHAASTGRGDCSEHGTSNRDSVVSAFTREPANTRYSSCRAARVNGKERGDSIERTCSRCQMISGCTLHPGILRRS